MVGLSEEFRRARQVVGYVVEREVLGSRACPPAVGCMIEVPRITLTAADLAAHADFLSIGSNNLTQFMLAVSRDDAEAGFVGSYVRDQVIAANPFERLDLVCAATGTAGPVQRRSRRTHALDGLAGLSWPGQVVTLRRQPATHRRHGGWREHARETVRDDRLVWPEVVRGLGSLRDGKHPLVAVTGLGVSVQDTRAAAAELNKPGTFPASAVS